MATPKEVHPGGTPEDSSHAKINSKILGRLAMRFINPKTDYAFKKIFGSEHSKNILISFFTALVYD